MMNINRINYIFYASLGLFLVTPFLVVSGLSSPYIATRIILWAVTTSIMIATTFLRVRCDQEFKNKLIENVRHPIVLVYVGYIAALFFASARNFSADAWWGSLVRTDGLFFELSWLLWLVCAAAWMRTREYARANIERWIVFVLGGVVIFSTVIFPLFRLDQFVGLLTTGARLAGSVGNPLYLASLLLFVPWFAARFRSLKITIAATIFALIGIYLTDVRGAMIAAVIGGVIYVWESKKISTRVRRGIIASAITFVIVVGGLFAAGKIHNTYRASTITTRITLWKFAAHEIAAHPFFGYGIGGHVDAIDRANATLSEVSYGEIADSAHSWFLDTALKGGLIALGLLVAWLIITYRIMDQWGRATLAAFIVVCATGPFMTWTAIPLMFVIATYIESRSVLQKNDQKIWAGAQLIGVLICASSIVLGIVTFSNARFLFRTEQALIGGNYTELPVNQPLSSSKLPFTKDWAISLFRFTMPSTERGIVLSFESFLNNIVKPIFYSIESRPMHPVDYNVAATWANFYATSGMSSDHMLWFEKSLALQRKAQVINPNRPTNSFQIADTLRELGRVKEAIAELRLTAEKNPNLPEAQIFYAMMVDISGDTGQAIEIVRTIQKKFPDYQWKEGFVNWLKDLEKRNQTPSM